MVLRVYHILRMSWILQQMRQICGSKNFKGPPTPALTSHLGERILTRFGRLHLRLTVDVSDFVHVNLPLPGNLWDA